MVYKDRSFKKVKTKFGCQYCKSYLCLKGLEDEHNKEMNIEMIRFSQFEIEEVYWK